MRFRGVVKGQRDYVFLGLGFRVWGRWDLVFGLLGILGSGFKGLRGEGLGFRV